MVIHAEFSTMIWDTFDRIHNFKNIFINYISLMFSEKIEFDLRFALLQLLIFKYCTICFQGLFIFISSCLFDVILLLITIHRASHLQEQEFY